MTDVFDEIAAAGIDVAVSGGDPAMIDAFGGGSVARFHTLDDALAHIERGLLTAVTPAEPADDAIDPPPWLSAFERHTLAAGETLMSAGDPGDQLAYLLHGSLGVYVQSNSGERHRMRLTQAPSWLGEIGFLRGVPRSADVIAETDIEFVTVDRAGFERLRATNPGLAADVLADIAITSVDRVATLTTALATSLD